MKPFPANPWVHEDREREGKGGFELLMVLDEVVYLNRYWPASLCITLQVIVKGRLSLLFTSVDVSLSG